MYCTRRTRNIAAMQDKSNCPISFDKKCSTKVTSEIQSSVDKVGKNSKKSSKGFLNLKCDKNQLLQKDKENVCTPPSIRSGTRLQVANSFISVPKNFTGKLHKVINSSISKEEKICKPSSKKLQKNSSNLKFGKNQSEEIFDKENVPVYQCLNKATKCQTQNPAMMKAGKVKKTKIDLCQTSQDETSDKVPKPHCPIWKVVATEQVSKQGTKRTRNRDIYDIAQDVEFKVEKIYAKMKPKHISSCKTKDVKTSKKKDTSTSNVKCKRKSQQNTRQTVNSECAVPKCNDMNQLPKTIPSESVRDHPKIMINLVEANAAVNSPNDTFALNELKDQHNSTPDKVPLPSTPIEAVAIEGNKQAFLQNFMEDFERSFIIPQMTSTPEASNLPPVVGQKFIVPMSELSTIPHIPSNNINGYLLPTPNETPESTLNQTPEPILSEIPEAISNESPAEEPVVSDNERDRSIFDSPIKKSIKRKKFSGSSKSPRRSMEIDLFGETPPLSPVKLYLEETVLKPKKAYHTPEQFRRHLSRTKKTLENKKPAAKSKVDKMIEKLNEHFEECGSFELCVE